MLVVEKRSNIEGNIYTENIYTENMTLGSDPLKYYSRITFYLMIPFYIVIDYGIRCLWKYRERRRPASASSSAGQAWMNFHSLSMC